MPERPPRLPIVFAVYDPALYFVTFNTNARRKLLANDVLHEQFVRYSRAGESHNVAVGRYVIMPDHIHLFVRGGIEFVLAQWVRLLKRKLSTAIVAPRPHWQEGFFDHLLRHSESYAEKWDYVRMNPVRAGLIAIADEWPYQGEITYLPF